MEISDTFVSCQPTCPSNIQEQEARIDFMRKRARGSDDNEEERTKQKKTAEEKPMTGGDQPKHINFFSDLQTGVSGWVRLRENWKDKRVHAMDYIQHFPSMYSPCSSNVQ